MGTTADKDQSLSKQNTVAKQDSRDIIRPSKPSSEDFRRLKRSAQQLVEKIDDLEKRSKG